MEREALGSCSQVPSLARPWPLGSSADSSEQERPGEPAGGVGVRVKYALCLGEW